MEEQKFEIEIEKVIEAIPERVETIKYERDFIENQIVMITAQRDEMIALKESELKECQDILTKMDEQNVISKEQFAQSVVEVKPTEETQSTSGA